MSEHGLTVGNPAIESVGSITFGPDDVLFVADNQRARVVALDVADSSSTAASGPFDLEDLDTQLASFLGCAIDDLTVRDMAVHPRTNNVYLSVMRGSGDAAVAVLMRIDHADGSLSALDLEQIAFADAEITNAPSADDTRLDIHLGEGDEVEFNGRKFRMARVPARQSTITDMAFVDGTLLVAGMSNEEFSSNLRRIPFPFTGDATDNSLEIFHVAHGKWETAAPIRTLIPYEDGKSILASYTCTPLVHFPLAGLAGGVQARGRTVAELGAGNQPLDMVSFKQGDEEYLMICHSTHPLMKICCSDIDRQEPLTEPKEPVGVPRATPDLAGISRMDNLNGDHVIVIQADGAGRRHLRSLKTASL